MNARTIQHPGVQIREIDLSEYTETRVVNNAYIIGFADKGPIYDFSWVTTQSEFLKIYGQPQNEAEKYLYYAAMSILNNGGTPIISRMPYDNKQCKTYKGLALRYAGVSQDKSNDPDSVKVWGWSTSPATKGDYFPDFYDSVGVYAFKGNNAIPLSATIAVPLTGVASLLGSKDSDQELLYKLQNKLYYQGNDYKTGDIKIGQVIYSLNPVPSSSMGQYFNTYSKINNDSKIIYDGLQPYYDKLINRNGLSGDTDQKNVCKSCNTEIIKLQDNIDKNPQIRGYSGLSGWFGIKNIGTKTIHISAYFNTTLLSSDYDISSGNIKFLTLPAIESYSYPTNEKGKKQIEKIALTMIEEYYPLSSGFINDLYKINTLNKKSTPVLEEKYRGMLPSQDCLFNKDGNLIGAIISLDSNKTTFNPELSVDQIKKTVYENFANMFIINKSALDNSTDEYYWKKYGFTGTLYYHGICPSTMELPYGVVSSLFNDTLLSTELDTRVSQIKSPSSITSLLHLMNSPKFWNTNASTIKGDNSAEINEAIIDAELLTQNGVGYQYGIYLDSKEVQISNYQYDDLVTSQKFTDGQNQTNSDCINDPDFKYRSDIRAANFIILDKQKSIATGDGSNEGYFVTIIDPYDSLKAQRLLSNPYTESELNNNSTEDFNYSIKYWTEQNKVDWNNKVANEINIMNMLQHVYNADNILIGENASSSRHKNLMNSWSTPLTGGYYDDSISHNLGTLYPQVPLADIKPGQKTGLAAMEKIYSSYIVVAVCKTVVDPSNGKITVSIIESFFGSLLDEKNNQNGRNMYIGDIINSSSNYIEFYRNKFVKNPYSTDDAFQVRIPQIYIKNSAELKEAAQTAGIDLALYDTNEFFDVFVPETYKVYGNEPCFEWDEFCELYELSQGSGSFRFAKDAFDNFIKKLSNIVGEDATKLSFTQFHQSAKFKKAYEDYFLNADKDAWINDALVILPSDFTDNLQMYSYQKLIKDLNYKANIFIFDKTSTCFYNNHPTAYFTSFSRKESQKIIANTTGLVGANQGTTINVAKNFLIDMDRCIKFIKNVDDVSIFFVVDAGLSTIAQFCDNITWDYFKKDKAFEPVTGGWITQQFDPDNDQDAEDRQITCIEDVNTWRVVVGKLDEISKEIRKDCMTIIDAPRQLTLDGAAPKIRKSKFTNDWEKKIGDKLKFISGINSSYTAGYYNWLRMTDQFSGKSFWLPPTCKVIGNLMYLNIMNLPWLAPAGFNYGVITGIHAISHNPGFKEEDQIYLKSWNYIKQYPYEGFVIEGQKTTLTKNSAFNRINVRTLFLDLERYVYNISKTFKYQVNNQYTREQYVQIINTKFADYQSRGGIYEYKIVCDETNNTWESIDRNELRATIYIKPARLIEYILVDFICTKSGANFEELT